MARAILGLLGVALASVATAGDEPVSAQKLVLKDAPGRAKLVFLSEDPRLAPPPLGSADDPATGSPGGAVIDLFSESGEAATILVPGGGGWRGSPRRYRYRNVAAPGGATVVRKMVLRDGRLKIVAKATGLALESPIGGVAMRIAFGTIRVCTTFGGASVRADAVGRYRAHDGVPPADCSDATLDPAVFAISLPVALSTSALASCAPGGVVDVSVPNVLGETWWVTSSGIEGVLDVLPTECGGGGMPYEARVGDVIGLANGKITPLLLAIQACLDASPPRDVFWIPIIGDVPLGEYTGTIESFALVRIVQVVRTPPNEGVDLEIACD